MCFVHIFFDEGCGMENLRAFMLVTSVKDATSDFRFYPDDIETNSSSAESIVQDGFYFAFDSRETAEIAITIIKDSSNIRSYELIDNPA